MSAKDALENMFASPRLIKDINVLSPDFLPDNLPHRKKDINKLSYVVSPALRGDFPSNVAIYGLPGTGKTAVTKTVLKALQELAKEKGVDLKLHYVNVGKLGSAYQTVRHLCSLYGVNVPLRGYSISEAFSPLSRELLGLNKTVIIALDEVDALADDHYLLYNLLRLTEMELRSTSNTHISLILITNDIHFKESLDARVLSSLGRREIAFARYNSDEIRDILLDRVQIGFSEDAVDPSAISLISALAGATSGDARYAIDLLRTAGEIAEQRADRKVTDEHVRQADITLEAEKVRELLRELPIHCKLILAGILSCDLPTQTGPLYDIYREICENEALEPLTQRRVSGIVNELDTTGLLRASVASLGRYGRTKRINIGVSRTLLVEGLNQDPRIAGILKRKKVQQKLA